MTTSTCRPNCLSKPSRLPPSQPTPNLTLPTTIEIINPTDTVHPQPSSSSHPLCVMIPNHVVGQLSSRPEPSTTTMATDFTAPTRDQTTTAIPNSNGNQLTFSGQLPPPNFEQPTTPNSEHSTLPSSDHPTLPNSDQPTLSESDQPILPLVPTSSSQPRLSTSNQPPEPSVVTRHFVRTRVLNPKYYGDKFPAIDLSAISDIDNSFTFARNSNAISTFGIIDFIFSAMVIFMRALAKWAHLARAHHPQFSSLALEKQQHKSCFSSPAARLEKKGGYRRPVSNRSFSR
nr:hypothetical protein Iba_chr01dCG4780 [Ipomoea batatas]